MYFFMFNFEKKPPIVHQKPNKCNFQKYHVREDCLSNVSGRKETIKNFQLIILVL